MSSRLIEECLDIENQEEEKYSRYITLQISNSIILVVDPYIIHIDDLKNLKSNSLGIVRIRRPGWGIGDLHRFIYKLEI